MKIQVENVSPVERKVTIEVDPERVAKELERAYRGLSRRVKVAGFRPGKAPRNVLERHYKPEVEGEVLEKLVQDTFVEAVKVESIAPVAPPQVSITEPLAEGQALKFSAKVEVKAKFEPKGYKGLKVEKKAAEVTDALIDEELKKLQDRAAKLEPVADRLEAKEGDWAVIDHKGTVDGAPFDGSDADGVTVKLEQGTMLDGNIPQLIGKAVGATVEFEQELPADYRVAAVAGKVAKMSVTLRGLRQKVLPALDEAFVKEIGLEGVETLDALKARMRADLEKRETRKVESEFKDALVKSALGENSFEVPPALVERAIDTMIEGAAERFARSGLDIRNMDLDFARMRGDLRDQALQQVRGALLLEAIADHEKVEVTEEDLQKELGRLSEDIGVPLEMLKKQMRGVEQREALKSRVREEKVLALMAAAVAPA
ncbi:MAG: trigger factor [Anaeromyxobacteraceae bacterium]